MDSHELIKSLLTEVAELRFNDKAKLDAILKRAKMILQKTFSKESDYVFEVMNISFFPSCYWEEMSNSYYTNAWQSGVTQLTNLLKTALEDLELSRPKTLENLKSTNKTRLTTQSKRIFVVHGHDNEMKLAVARVLEKLGLEPVILHERPDKGLTVIEKFVHFSDVGFAIVLLSPDDLAYSRNENPNAARPRARQNVVLELGFFLGKLGRGHVVALHKDAPDFEMPSDYSGVLFKKFDDANGWPFALLKELKENGYDVDANKLT